MIAKHNYRSNENFILIISIQIQFTERATENKAVKKSSVFVASIILRS